MHGHLSLCILQLIALYIFRKESRGSFAAGNLFNGGTTAIVCVALVVVGYNYFKPKPSGIPVAQSVYEKDIKAQQPPALAPAKEIPLNRSAYSGLGEDYRMGPDDARVVVVEFADFQCPACKQGSELVHDIAANFGRAVQIVFKNYPLDPECNPTIKHRMHEFACISATLARCAGQIGKFWAFYDRAYKDQDKLNKETARLWAKSVGLSDGQIDACLASKDLANKIKDDVAVADKAGLTGTPTFYINGHEYVGGREFAAVKIEIDRLLAE